MLRVIWPRNASNSAVLPPPCGGGRAVVLLAFEHDDFLLQTIDRGARVALLLQRRDIGAEAFELRIEAFNCVSTLLVSAGVLFIVASSALKALTCACN